MLLELAIGDAYGAGFEYVRDRRFLNQHNHLAGYVKHPTHKIKPGAYTDDTQMSIAIAELIVEQQEWTPENIARNFLDVFHQDKREGYAGGFFAFLKKTRTAQEFLAHIHPDSDKSGAAMRAAPIGVYSSVAEVIRRCTVQAELTHNTPDGKNAAIAVSLMTHYFLHGLGPKVALPEFLCAHVPGPWREPWLGEVGSRGRMSVRAALTSLLRNDSLSRVLKSCVAWGGDTDTVAAIALAAGSCCKEISQDLPEKLVNGLENGRYGREFLIALDTKLMRLRKRQARTLK
jgi:ADP-ribosylglycohydrolase